MINKYGSIFGKAPSPSKNLTREVKFITILDCISSDVLAVLLIIGKTVSFLHYRIVRHLGKCTIFFLMESYMRRSLPLSDTRVVSIFLFNSPPESTYYVIPLSAHVLNSATCMFEHHVSTGPSSVKYLLVTSVKSDRIYTTYFSIKPNYYKII